MSGELVGLVMDHGPQDHNAWAVLTVIAEDLRGPMRESVLANEDLERAARLSRSSVKRAVALLVADGWIARQAGAHKGLASTYRLRLETFPAEPVNNLLERGSHRTPNGESGSTEGVHTEPLRAPKGSTQTPKGFTQDPPSVSVQTPFPVATTDEHLPGVVAGVRIGPDETYVRTALETFRLHSPSDTTRRHLGALHDAGWLAVDVNAHLRSNIDARAVRDMAKVVGGRLRDLAAVEPPRHAERPTGPMCAVCSLAESECRRRAPVSGHAFTEAAPEPPRPSKARGATSRPDPLDDLPRAPLTMAEKRQARLDASIAAM